MRCRFVWSLPCLRLVAVCLLLWSSALALAAPALAQSQVLDAATGGGSGGESGDSGGESNRAGDGTITAKELRDLIATLEDSQARQELLDQLKALAEAREASQAEQSQQGDSGDLVSRISDRLAGVNDEIAALARDIDDGSDLLAWAHSQIEDPAQRERLLADGADILLTLIMAAVAWFVLVMLTREHLSKLESKGRRGWAEQLFVAFGRLVLLLVPVAALAGATYLTMMLIGPSSVARALLVALVNAVVLTRIATSVSRSLFSPLSDELRPLPLSDEQAAYLHVWVGRFAVVGFYGFFLVDFLGALGLPDSSAGLLMRLVGLALAAMALVVVLQLREPVSAWIRSQPGSGAARVLRERFADIWHVLALLAVLAVFVVWAINIEGGFVFLARGLFGTALALFGAMLVCTLLHRGVNRLFRIGSDLRERFPGLERRANRYVAVLNWLLNLAVWAIALMLVLEAWGLDILGVFTTPEGAEILSRLVAIVVIFVIAVIVWELGDGLISRALSRESDEATMSARLKTLLPLLRNALMIGVGVIAVITALSEIGMDIGPLLAGAGVVGLAIGFGAQALVKDIITGAFMLFEDQFSVGDWIDAAGKMGGVEGITIRTLRLRDLDGYLHTIPFGEITVLTNLMRDFGYAVIDVGVAYKENTDDVIAVLREVDEDARKDEAFVERLAGDFEVLGVNDLGDSAVTIRTRVKTLAGYQWGVRREYLRRIKLKFDEVGIEIPFPHMTVWMGEMKGGGRPPPIAHVRIDAEEVDWQGARQKQQDEEEAPDTSDESASDVETLKQPAEDDRT